jgi:hypothetical protein
MSKSSSEIFSGKWRNQLGSEMELSVTPEGRVAGQFRSAVGTASHAHSYPLVGFAESDLISFCVSFGGHGVAAWVGQHTVRQGRERIATMWHLEQDIPNEQEARWLWSGVRAGSDVFTRE